MATASLLPMPRANFFDANGDPLAGGFVYTFVPGGSTPRLTWQDAAETIPNDNPIVLDANGSCLLYGDGPYQLTVTDALGNSVPAYSGLTIDVLGGVGGLVSPAVANIAALRAATTASLANSQCYVLGYYTSADGGEGEFVYLPSDVASSDNSGTIIVDASQRRWHRETEGQPSLDKWFGAKVDGTTDDRSAIIAMIAATPAGGAVRLAAGNRIISNEIPISKILTVLGYGRRATTITTSNATANIFTITSEVDIYDVGFNASVPKTAGAYAQYGAGTTRSRMSRFWMVNGCIGIDVLGSSGGDVEFTDGEIFNWTSSGGGVQLAAPEVTNMSNIFMQQGLAPGLGFGIRLLNGGGVFENIDIAASGVGLFMAPASGQAVVSAWFNDCFFDNCTTNVVIAPTGTGFVGRNRFANCWMSSGTVDGVVIASPSMGSVNGIDFLACHIYANALNGVNVQDARAFNLRFSDCQIAGNGSPGINLFAGGSFFEITNNTIGATGGFGDNGGGAINIGAASNNFQIIENRLQTTGPGAIFGFPQSGPNPGVTEIIRDNIGYVSETWGTASILTGDLTATIAHGLSGTPPGGCIMLTLQTSMINGGGTANYLWSPNTSNSTNFNANMNAVCAADVVFAWRAKLPCA